MRLKSLFALFFAMSFGLLLSSCTPGVYVGASTGYGYPYGGGYGYPPEDQPTTALRQADPAGQTSMMPPINHDDGGYGYDDRPDRRRGGQKKSNTSTILLVLAGILVLVGAIFIGVSLFDKKEGNRQVSVPQLVGQTVDAATGLAANAGVKMQQAGTERCDQPKGSICRQTPVADGSTKMETDGTIQVYVSEGAPLTEVPDVVEQSQERAEESLKDKGFKVKVEQEESDEDPGTVLRQNPQGGTKAEKNSEITITVAKQKLKTVPPVVGNQFAQAEQQLKALGFVVVTEYVDSEKPKDEVLEQTPNGNASAAEGAEVKLRISKGPQQPAQVQIPADIATKPFKDVKAQLEALGLVVQQQGSDKEDAMVVGSNPQAGSMVNAGETVTVYTVGGGGNPGGNGDNGDNPGNSDGGGIFG
jgi:beta-lactam-binding protein with PASTA domain